MTKRTPLVVSCLACGHVRETRRTQNGLESVECPLCGYIGWRELVPLVQPIAVPRPRPTGQAVFSSSLVR